MSHLLTGYTEMLLPLLHVFPLGLKQQIDVFSLMIKELEYLLEQLYVIF